MRTLWNPQGQTGSHVHLSLHLNSVLLAICWRNWWPSSGTCTCTSLRTPRNWKRMGRRVSLNELPVWLLSCAIWCHQISHKGSEMQRLAGPCTDLLRIMSDALSPPSKHRVYSCMANLTQYHKGKGIPGDSVFSLSRLAQCKTTPETGKPFGIVILIDKLPAVWFH